MALSASFFLALFALLSAAKEGHLFCKGDPTDGFTAVPLTNRNFELQWPYNLPLSDRYSDVGGVRKFWVYTTDKPLRPNSGTKPRSELRIKVYIGLINACSVN